MAATSPVDGVRALATAAARSAGLVLEDVTVTPAGRRRVLRVVVDLPEDQVGGVPMDAVAAASQALSQALDAGDVMGGQPYVLEVSSPGADRPLTERRHWSRARRRLVRATLRDGRVVTGRLTAVDDEGVRLGDAVLAWPDVARGVVELEFGAVDLDGELDEHGLDEHAQDEDALGDELDEDGLNEDELDEELDDDVDEDELDPTGATVRAPLAGGEA